MNHFARVVALTVFSGVMLAGCGGGSSDSSASAPAPTTNPAPNNPGTPNPGQPDANANITASCVVSNGQAFATTTGCLAEAGGQQAFACVNGRVKSLSAPATLAQLQASNSGISGATVTINGLRVSCG